MQKNRAEVHLKDMSELELQQIWRKASSRLDTESIEIHVGEKARRPRETTPKKQILESRFVKTRREKPDEPGVQELKCRWCIKGYKDPEALDVDKQAPTLAADTLAMTLQVIASSRWRLQVADIEGAFLQGPSFERPGGNMYVQLPLEPIPRVPPGAMVEIKKHVYGLVDAPRKWWQCLSGELQKLGMKTSALDPCCYYWHRDGTLQGILAFHVDDLVFGGSELFRRDVLDRLKQRFPFKHWSEGQAQFLGRRLRQREDFSIDSDQQEYASKVSSVFIGRERRKEKDSRLTPKEMTQYRGILGAANWLVGSTRPDVAAMNAFLQQRVAKATIEDLIEANKLVSLIKDYAHITMRYKSIPLEKGVMLLATDASWANGSDLRSQAAHVILFGDDRLQHEQWSDVTPLRWRSFKLERHTQSTLGSELMSLARGIAECDWMRSLFAEARFPEYDLAQDQLFREKIKTIITIDNKPIYDHTQGDGIVVKDKRLAIDMLLVRRDIRRHNMILQWVDTRQMIADSLTKSSADAGFLRFVLKHGEYIVVAEQRSLDWRSQEKAKRKAAKESGQRIKKGGVKHLHALTEA